MLSTVNFNRLALTPTNCYQLIIIHMTTIIALLISAIASAGAILLTHEQINQIYISGIAKVNQINEINRSGIYTAAVIQWQLSTGNTDTPTARQLVDAGLLTPSFIE